MALFNDFPYTNFHELNLDWIIRQMRFLADKLESMDGSGPARPFYGSKALLIGDGMAYGLGAVAGQGWPYYLSRYLDLQARTIWQTGAGFYTPASGTPASYADKNFQAAIETEASNMSSAEKAAVRLVVIAGGQHDAGVSSSTLRLATESTVNSASILFPNARICIYPLHGPELSITGRDMNALTVIGEAAAHSGAAVWPDAFKWLISRTTDFDGDVTGYPSEEGYEYIGRYMASCLSGWDGEIVTRFYEVTYGEDVTDPTFDGVNDNGQAIIHFTATLGNWDPTEDERELLQIGSLTGRPGRNISFPAKVLGSFGIRWAMVDIRTNGKLVLRATGLPASSTDVTINVMLNYPVYYY